MNDKHKLTKIGGDIWQSARLVEREMSDNPEAMKFFHEIAEHDVQKIGVKVRFPTLKHPYYVSFNRENFAELTPKGHKPRDRWRSLVVQFNKLEKHQKVETRYQIQYMATLHVWSTNVEFWYDRTE